MQKVVGSSPIIRFETKGDRRVAPSVSHDASDADTDSGVGDRPRLPAARWQVLTDVGGEGMASGSADACRASAVISRADLSVLIRTRRAFVSLVLRLERLRFANRCSILR